MFVIIYVWALIHDVVPHRIQSTKPKSKMRSLNTASKWRLQRLGGNYGCFMNCGQNSKRILHRDVIIQDIKDRL